MEKQRKLKQPILVVALVTVAILMVPLVAMQFTDEVDWSIADFIIISALLFGTGVSFVLITRYTSNIVYRAAIGLALGSMLFMVWANLGVGLIGAGPHLGNLMYIGVVAVGIIGTVLSRFSPAGMERAMYAVTFSLVLLAVIALLAGMGEYPGSSVNEIIGVNGFFAGLFAVAGALFRYAAHQQSLDKSDG